MNTTQDAPTKILECCCCGGATKGRQWWNRDDGYGLCDSCIEYCGADVAMGETDPEKCYGVRGYHYGLVN